MAKRKKVSSEKEKDKGAEDKPFEAHLSELEEVVQQLEAGDRPLEESIELFEKGERARKSCLESLDKFEKRIRVLKSTPGGKPRLEDEDVQDDDPDEMDLEEDEEGSLFE